jgi:hypothetical protein
VWKRARRAGYDYLVDYFTENGMTRSEMTMRSLIAGASVAVKLILRRRLCALGPVKLPSTANA